MRRGLNQAQFSGLVGGGLLLFSAAIFASGLHIKAREASPSVTVEDIPALSDAPLEGDDAAAMAEAAGISPPDDGGAVSPLEPEAAPESESQMTAIDPDSLEAAPDVLPDDWSEKLLYRPTASQAGLLEAQGYRIAIRNVVPTALDETCGDTGASWPCGAAARTQFRNFIRGRALTCTVPQEAPAEVIETDCSVGGDDVGEWLAAQGWAGAGEGSALKELSEQARAAHRGMFGAKPVLPALVSERAAVPELPLPPSPPSIIAPASQAAAPAITEDRGAFPPAPTLPAQ